MGKRREPKDHEHGGKDLTDEEADKLNEKNDEEFRKLMRRKGKGKSDE